jgi:putative SOS response-associated peptidase YedK
MCGRFTLTVSGRVLARLFDVPEVAELTPRYNIAPTQQVLIARATEGGGGRELVPARWGLIPFWAKDEKIGARMINARAESVSSKPAFRAAVKHRRCLIPADGFYEWRKTGSGKQPYLIRFADRRPFAFAGLWERWHPDDGEPVDSCTIITTSPNELVAELHDRMPVILSPDGHGEWLTADWIADDRLNALLVPHAPDQMEAYPVSTRVNRPINDDPGCIEPLDQGNLLG